MASHPVNLIVRFLLELSGLVALGYWGWLQGRGPLRWLLVVGIPLTAAFLWGTFAVPDDPSRSGRAPVPVPGRVRLILEFAFFAIGTWAFYHAGHPLLAFIFGTMVLVHYLVSYDRVGWLINVDRKGKLR